MNSRGSIELVGTTWRSHQVVRVVDPETGEIVTVTGWSTVDVRRVLSGRGP